jgi:hypothetical protein
MKSTEPRATRFRRLTLAGAASLGALHAPPALYAKPIATTSSSAEQQREVNITVYNQNFGLVREVRDAQIGTGTIALEFRDVAAQIQPATVHIKSLSGATGLRILEQNYRYDLLTPAQLLEKHVGKSVRVYRYNERTGREEVYDADVLSVADGQPVLKINGEITYGMPGRLAFAKLPDNLIAKPTLVWLLESAHAKHRLEVTYLTQNLNWSADYVFVLNEEDTAGDLTGWVTLTNQSGASYKNARLKLVAGDVQRVAAREMYAQAADTAYAQPQAPSFKQEAFFEYHLYTLQHPTDVLQNEQKQVSLLEAKGASLTKKLIFYGEQSYFRGRYGQIVSNQKVGTYLDLENSQKNRLGMPLPKGVVRVYKADKNGAKQFVGEDEIDHTPRDEKLRIKLGEAFDVVGDRKQSDWRSLGACASETGWEVELRNHKDKPVQIEIYEPIGGEWQVMATSHPYAKKDAHTFTFDVKVPANGKSKVSYRVRVRWC